MTIHEVPEPMADTRAIAMMSDNEVDFFWLDIMQGLNAAPGLWETVTVEWIYAQHRRGLLQFWMVGERQKRVPDLFVITQIHTMVSDVKELHVIWMYGEKLKEHWSFMMPTVERLALQLGIDRIVVRCSRRGLEEMLKKEDFRMRAIEMVRDLKTERVH